MSFISAALVDDRLRPCTTDRVRRRSSTIAKIIPAVRFAGDQPAVCGLLHVLQALKHVCRRIGAKTHADPKRTSRPTYWL